jgi:hypothetical protein
MCVIPERLTIASAILLLCATVAAVAPRAVAADTDGDRPNPLEAAAISLAKRSTLPQPTAPAPRAVGVPAVRAVEAEDGITGSEPDPETFDRRGLETWWQKQGPRKP